MDGGDGDFSFCSARFAVRCGGGGCYAAHLFIGGEA